MKVFYSFLSPVFHLLGVDIVEESIYGEVSPQSVSVWGSLFLKLMNKYNLRYSRFLVVGLVSEIDEIELMPAYFGGGSFQMFA